MFDIPYKWYTENGIPVVLGTDGGGMYFTSAKNEASIAETFGGRAAIKSIRSDDSNVIERRGL